jgi:predicted DNA-binding transcriptional regulator YafY
MRLCHKLRITYLDREDAFTVTVHPYRLYSQPPGIRLIAYCEQSGEVEHYRLEQITEVLLTDEDYVTES